RSASRRKRTQTRRAKMRGETNDLKRNWTKTEENAKTRKGESAKSDQNGDDGGGEGAFPVPPSRFRPLALSRSPAGAYFLVDRAQHLCALPVFAFSSGLVRRNLGAASEQNRGAKAGQFRAGRWRREEVWALPSKERRPA